MTEIRKHLPSRAAVAVALAAVAAVAVAVTSFWRSFTAIAELAVEYMVPADQAWMIPVAVDGLVVVATVAAAVARHRIARGYSWALLVAGTIVSVAGNGIHAWQLTESPIGVGIAVMPPLVTLAAVHLTILLARQDDDTATAPARDTAPEPTTATVADDAVGDVRQETTPSRPVTRLRVAPATPPRPAATPRQDCFPATPKANATDAELEAVAIHRVVYEKKTVRATGAELGISKDKVQRWVSAYRAERNKETAAS